jgi:hypothetical protein
MRVKRVVVVVLALLSCAGMSLAQQAKPAPKEAMEPPMKQLEAFRRDDFDTAYSFASADIQQQFDRQAFEQMVKGGYPEIARSTSAAVAESILGPDGTVYVTLKIRGSNGKSIEALYELVLEEGKWKINGVRSRPDPGQV